MLQYNIPQFIDSEDKIIGPVTITQFASLIIGTVVLVFVYLLTPNTLIFAIIGTPIGAITIAFAFAKINGQGLATFLTNVITYVQRPSIYLWSREIISQKPIIKAPAEKKKHRKTIDNKEYNQNRVEEIAWTLDTYGQKEVMTEDDST